MRALKIDSEKSWTVFKLNCKQLMQVKWVLILSKSEHSKLRFYPFIVLISLHFALGSLFFSLNCHKMVNLISKFGCQKRGAWIESCSSIQVRLSSLKKKNYYLKYILKYKNFVYGTFYSSNFILSSWIICSINSNVISTT